MGRVDVALARDAMVVAHKVHGLDATVDEIRTFFENDHVHMAVVVNRLMRLVTAIERADLETRIAGSEPASRLGTLRGRTVRASDPLEPLTEQLRREGRRRMAVVDDACRLVGLLCFKRSGRGYCTDDGILDRERERLATARLGRRCPFTGVPG